MKVNVPQETLNKAKAWGESIIDECVPGHEAHVFVTLAMHGNEVVLDVRCFNVPMSLEDFFKIDGMYATSIEKGGAMVSGILEKQTVIDDWTTKFTWVPKAPIDPEDIRFLVDGGFVLESFTSTYACPTEGS